MEVMRVDSGDVAVSMRLLVGYGRLDYGKVHEAEMALEVKIAELAALRANDRDIVRLQELLESHRKALTREDLHGATAADCQFHQELGRISGNELLICLLHPISDVLTEAREKAMQVQGVSQLH